MKSMFSIIFFTFILNLSFGIVEHVYDFRPEMAMGSKYDQGVLEIINTSNINGTINTASGDMLNPDTQIDPYSTGILSFGILKKAWDVFDSFAFGSINYLGSFISMFGVGGWFSFVMGTLKTLLGFLYFMAGVWLFGGKDIFN